MESQRSIHPSIIHNLSLLSSMFSTWQHPEFSTSSNYPLQQIIYACVTKDTIPAAHSLNKWGDVSMATIERNVPPKHKWLPLMKILLPLRLACCNPQRKKKNPPPYLQRCLQLQTLTSLMIKGANSNWAVHYNQWEIHGGAIELTVGSP